MNSDLRDEFDFSEEGVRVADLTLSSVTISVQWMTKTTCTCLALP